jgi:hypothetical protein
MAVVQGRLRSEIELSGGSRRNEKCVPKVCFGHLSIAYRTARVHRRGIAPEGNRSSKLSEGAPQHGVKGRQIVLGELSPIAGAALLFLSRLSPQQSTEHQHWCFAERARLIR